MTITAELGQKGEDVAKEHLIKLGYEVLHTNWRSGQKEVDIIAKNKNLLIFVEVKTRSSAFIAEPYKAVNKNKQKMLLSAAQSYIDKQKAEMEVRFDVISIISNNTSHQLEHIEDAYRAYAR